ncbi:MAG: hypothetical protein ABIY70_02645 [Capsulimonas sp.]
MSQSLGGLTASAVLRRFPACRRHVYRDPASKTNWVLVQRDAEQ